MAMGRGMDALFDAPPERFDAKREPRENEVLELKLTEVEPRANQPRKHFDREQLQILANSITQHGVIQPIIVTKNDNGTYSIIAGERRWRASRLAGKATIPAVVRSYDELASAEVSLIENLQREDLNPIEEARGYRELMTKFGLTQESVSEKVGKSRPAVANTLRLLTLEPEIQEMLEKGALTSGHARALLSVEASDTRLKMARTAAEKSLTVREMEEAARKTKKKTPAKKKSSYYPDVEEDLQNKLGTRVRLTGEEKGKIEISYFSEEDLIRIIDIFDKIKS